MLYCHPYSARRDFIPFSLSLAIPLAIPIAIPLVLAHLRSESAGTDAHQRYGLHGSDLNTRAKRQNRAKAAKGGLTSCCLTVKQRPA